MTRPCVRDDEGEASGLHNRDDDATGTCLDGQEAVRACEHVHDTYIAHNGTASATPAILFETGT